MKSVKFVSVIGVVAGYSGNDMLLKAQEVAPDAMSKAWQQAAKEVFDDTGIYVSSNVTPSKTVYHEEWGCPIGGEPTFMIEGCLNPQFGEVEPWKEAVVKCVKKVKKAFGQSTVTVEFSEIDHVYLTD